MQLTLKTTTISFLLFSLTILSSCETIKLTNRKDKDVGLNSDNYGQLKGRFSNYSNDTINYQKTLIENFQHNKTLNQKGFSVALEPIDLNTINLKLYKTDTLVINLTIKGKYKNGYFKVKRHWDTEFIAGPLLWILGDELEYIGLTKEKNLVVINSGGGAQMFIVIVPCFGAGGGQFENVYTRTK